jgi:membrane protein
VAALLRQTLKDWFRHRCMSKGAALAFYALFSLAPVLVLMIAVAGFIFGPDAAAGEIVRQFRGLIGQDGAAAVQAAINGAHSEADGLIASVIAGVTLFIGSTTAFAELKESLDELWESRRKKREGFVGALRDRFLSFGLVLVLAFLLLVSLIVNAGLAVLSGFWRGSAGGPAIAAALSSVLTFFVIAALFAAIFKLLPAERLSWSDVILGALICATLFEIGKHLIGLYLGNAAITSTFGAAGSLGVLALWVYYSAQIFFLGAEFTRLYARGHGSLRHQPNQGESHEDRKRPAGPQAHFQA